MSQLTKADLAAIHQADAIVVALNDGKGSVRLVWTPAGTVKNPFPHYVEYMLDVPVTAHTGPTGNHSAHESLYSYSRGPGQSILLMLKVGDQIRFNFFPDANTNPLLAQVGLHADVLELDVHRKIGKRTERFTFHF